MRSDWEERQAPALLTPPGLRTPPPPPPMSSPVLTLVLVRRASSTRRMPQLEWVLGLGGWRAENLLGAARSKDLRGEQASLPNRYLTWLNSSALCASSRPAACSG